MKNWLLTVAAAVFLMLSGCHPAGTEAPDLQARGALMYAAATGPKDSMEQEALYEIKESIMRHAAELEERYRIKVVTAGIGQGHILLAVRRSGEVEEKLAEEEMERLKAALFAWAGRPFPIRITVQSCCTREPGITGRITAFDKEQGRVLVVNVQHKTDGGSPDAAWVQLASDGILITGGRQQTGGLDVSLVGHEVEVWTTGMVLQSYPVQVSALKLVVE